MNIDIFDPEMCCSTGLCGTSPDPELIRVGKMVEQLKANGHQVARHMLSRDPLAFSSNKKVYESIMLQGVKSLPIVAINGEIVSTGSYPQFDDLVAAQEV